MALRRLIKLWVLTSGALLQLRYQLYCTKAFLRALESTLKAHIGTGAGATGAFSGKGQTLGGSKPQGDLATSASTAAAGITNLDPQVKLFIGLIGAYLLLWYFSS
jgi:thioredoxin